MSCAAQVPMVVERLQQMGQIYAHVILEGVVLHCLSQVGNLLIVTAISVAVHILRVKNLHVQIAISMQHILLGIKQHNNGNN
jgi:hypothetical protein